VICVSINEEVVHGIPNENRVINDGDLVSVDCGAIIDGWHGDAAITIGVGNVKPEHQQRSEPAASHTRERKDIHPMRWWVMTRCDAA